jgi:hypothetical protein
MAAGINITPGNANDVTVTKGHLSSTAIPRQTPPISKLAANSDPIISLGASDAQIKLRTGFPSKSALLSYIFVMCNNGDVETIKTCVITNLV